jgi:hypothetical protein
MSEEQLTQPIEDKNKLGNQEELKQLLMDSKRMFSEIPLFWEQSFKKETSPVVTVTQTSQEKALSAIMEGILQGFDLNVVQKVLKDTLEKISPSSEGEQRDKYMVENTIFEQKKENQDVSVKNQTNNETTSGSVFKR